MSQNKELRELIGLVGYIKLQHRHKHIEDETDTDYINGIEMGQTQQTSFDINSDFTDVPEVSEKGVECFNGNIDEHEHAKNVENTIDSDHL